MRPGSKGAPGGAKGEQVTVTARIVNLADVLEVFHRTGGVQAAVEVARQRSGTQFDPLLAELVASEAPLLFGDLDQASTWTAVIDSEPAASPPLTSAQLDSALEAIGDFTDLKSPYTLGHTRAVAGLATAAATALSWSAGDVTHVRRAALLHDLGWLGVSNAVWDKPGPLSPAQIERVRLHPYLTERMLASSPALPRLGATAAQHHERIDGSGYPRGLRGDTMTPLVSCSPRPTPTPPSWNPGRTGPRSRLPTPRDTSAGRSTPRGRTRTAPRPCSRRPASGPASP
jgi:HD-GYP domain-containing protein (c-di-GMP phosphodiesterase class II)